jgi:aspartyl-tRNA(Asn)/glutamyl-tRNA(Gln) amidotransferase subunit B
MPDPDLAPVVIDEKLTRHLGDTLGVLPDEELRILESEYGITMKDAIDLVSLNDGGRVEYFRNVVDVLTVLNADDPQTKLGKLASNWVLHELGALISDYAEEENPLKFTSYGSCIISHSQMGHLIHYLDHGKITGKTAKKVLKFLFENEQMERSKSVEDIIEDEGLWLRQMSMEEYEELARSILDMEVVEEILSGKEGKINFLLGKMMREDKEGRVEPQQAREVLERIVEGFRKDREVDV